MTNWKEIDDLKAKLATPRLAVNQSELDEVKFVAYDFGDRKRFPKSPSQVELMMLTDTQIGSKAFQRSRFVEYRDWLLSVPHRYAFLGGDMIDAATPLSVGTPHDDTSEPFDQVDEATQLLRPLADAGRILGYVGGNHERRTIKTFGDSGRLLARNLQVPYSRGVQLIDIRYGAHKPFKVSLWHGSGAARTKGARAQMLHRFMGQADSHLYLVGHLHDAVMLMDWRQQRQGKRIKLQKIAGCMSSSFMGYWCTYAEVAGLSPSDTMMARTILYPNGHWEITWR